MLSQLEKYVITYEDNTGKIVCNIPDYYDMCVAPLAGKFAQYSFNNGAGKVVCPIHDDHDPSLGLIRHKNVPKVMIYHCLGCGAAGTIVRFHQRIESKYHNRDISVKEACIELCKIFNIDVPSDDVFSSEDYEKKYEYLLSRVDVLQGRYTRQEFAENLLSLRKQGVSLERLNSECIKMIATEKGLYTWS